MCLMLTSCGNGNSTESGGHDALRANRPEIHPPSGPPPKKLVVKDLELGSGPAVKPGDRIGILYVGVDYETGEERYHRWFLRPLRFRFGSKYLAPGLERGLIGMKVGGRRELIIPSRLAYGTGAVDYVVELASRRSGR